MKRRYRPGDKYITGNPVCRFYPKCEVHAKNKKHFKKFAHPPTPEPKPEPEPEPELELGKRQFGKNDKLNLFGPNLSGVKVSSKMARSDYNPFAMSANSNTNSNTNRFGKPKKKPVMANVRFAKGPQKTGGFLYPRTAHFPEFLKQ